MRFLKTYKQFEDATANATTAGMGAVTSSQPSANAGATTGDAFTSGGGVEGSGDISFTFKKEKRKKGSASEVSDMRDLEDNSKIGDKFPVEEIKE